MEEKTYIIVCEDKSKKRITVPANWKVTFGPAARGENAGIKSGTHLKIPMALRFYETDTKQRAIFTDVVSFRDASIKIEEERTNVQEKEGYVECDGVRKKTVFSATVKEWINPDSVNEPVIPTGFAGATSPSFLAIENIVLDGDQLRGSCCN